MIIYLFCIFNNSCERISFIECLCQSAVSCWELNLYPYLTFPGIINNVQIITSV